MNMQMRDDRFGQESVDISLWGPMCNLTASWKMCVVYRLHDLWVVMNCFTSNHTHLVFTRAN